MPSRRYRAVTATQPHEAAAMVEHCFPLDPLVVLLDFLVGESVATLARKNRLPSEHVEQAIRIALSAYGFDAACEAERQ